jgi:glycosyltransferase involved in cell wall biosynthesis
MKKKIAVYAISLNEESFVQRFYESCKDADLIVIADTGSTDGTVELARSLGIQVYTITVSPWRFDTARNIALGLIPKDIDICIALDLDEVMTPGWYASVQNNWKSDITRLQYRFDNQGDIYNCTKIHLRTGYQWRHLIHEMIEPDARMTEVWAITEDILSEHHPDLTKSRGQYLPMLNASIAENPYDHRDSWYLGREFFYHQQWLRAIKEWDRYLTLPGATWHHERSFALRHMGRAYMHLGQHELALKHFRMAVDTSRLIRDTWVDLAQACYELKQWHECYYAATQALTITSREYVFTSTGEPWSFKTYDLAALSAYNLGLREQAVANGTQALELNPDDARLFNNLEYYLALAIKS